MSWLNDSLNKVKGQITSFAQEVLAEGIVEEETEEEIEGRRFNPIKELEHAKDQIGQLTGLCATQDQEIATLRKQIAEFQQLKTEQALPSSKLIAKDSPLLTDQNAGPSTSTQHPPVPAASALEDSWFWDPEQNVSSTSSSSKKDDDPENDSPRSGADLTTIPLEPPATEGEIIERLHRQLTDKSQQLKKQMLENALLNENLTQMSGENRELNENIEELDRQHELVVENLLTAKKNLQDRCSQLEEELRIKQGEASVTKELDELKVSYGKLEQSYVNSCQESVQLKAELERIVVENIDAVAGLEGEITELKKTLEESQNSSEAVDHKSNTLARENAKLDEQLAILKDENEQLGKKLEQMTTQSEQLAKAEDECEQLKRELEELKRKSEEDAFVALDQTELEELRKNYEALAAEVERWKTDCDRLQEDNLVLQKKLEERKPDETQVAQLQQEVSELQNELRSVIIDNSVQLDAKEKEWQEKLNFVKAENSRIQHSKDTLEADLMQYEKECGNLMKNNDLLIAEIDNLKCKKLETINENAEDSIVILERQLEESTMLNKSLEDEYQEVNKKLEEVLEEREELDAKVENYQKTLEEKTRIVYDLRMTVEALEAEKAHLLFEVNEAKAKESTSEELDELEQHKLQVEDLRAQLSTINEDHASLVLKLQQLQQTSIENTRNSEAKLSELEAKESAIKQLQADLLRVSETANETTSDGAAKVLEERLEAEASKATALAVEKDEVEEKLAKAVEELDQVRAEFEEASKSNATKVAELTQAVEGITQQKDNLVQLVTVKHNENVQYHAEIQRLSQLLQTELAAKNEAKADSDECSSLRERLAQLEAQTSKLADFDKMADQIQFLREKSDILTNNLLIEQNNQKVLQQEKQEVIEQKNGLAKDLERLRQHLLEIEEAHTLETVELQQRYDEARGKLQTLEEDVKKSSNAQKSASIRANQHAETLQAQYHLLQQQRDELAAKLSAADDRDYKNLASLTNLQVALEQFQNNKERDIELATLAIRRDLEQAQAREMALKGDIRQLQQQLADAKNGLLAAARISDQLEIAQVTVASLREELSKSNDRYLQLEGRLQATEANQADKVEKSLVKNLVIGYVVAPNQNDKHQILKLISAVLTMDQNECTKVGLNKSGGGWFNSILGSGAAATNYNKESLTEAFVKFLEKESTPRPPNPAGSSLLNIMANQPSPPSTHPSRTTTPTQASAAADQVPVTPVQPVILLGGPTEFQPQRSSSSILKDILSDS
ncbi:thyroid receptor-interacting protein 11 isoform X1 [Culex pipiens pallens]|uniref:thyroid receptor-interacting protein 11 isoform X1 n=1 Tax=Culex pipiens pallens TaxID=42434 RepID=UPI0019549C2A|nr:thyroid receptor-interacting protein 11 isoform X1 [Culex pipiens pallens]